MQQLNRAAWINEDPVHIETVNTQGEYKCIMMRVITRVGFIGGKDMGPSIG